jgi:homoserine O-succinyltransferase
LQIAFFNNMPDAALEDTEMQFFGLLEEASGGVPVSVSLYSLTGVPRGERGKRHLDGFYCGLDEFWKKQFDGVIITGTEPRQADLRDEPYWRFLTKVFDWAERTTTSAVLSCLAAHASVLHSDGIERQRLPDKQFGVFDAVKKENHSILSNTPETIRFPHSRWNELREADLIAAGYTVLTQSAAAGVDTFLKRRGDSLFLYFQGHPEYGLETLFKEYRRDIKRYLNRERETYPTMPTGYFGPEAGALLLDFEKRARAERHDEIMALFPENELVRGLADAWHATAIRLYRNWLEYLAGVRAGAESPKPVLTERESSMDSLSR